MDLRAYRLYFWMRLSVELPWVTPPAEVSPALPSLSSPTLVIPLNPPKSCFLIFLFTPKLSFLMETISEYSPIGKLLWWKSASMSTDFNKPDCLFIAWNKNCCSGFESRLCKSNLNLWGSILWTVESVELTRTVLSGQFTLEFPTVEVANGTLGQFRGCVLDKGVPVYALEFVGGNAR